MSITSHIHSLVAFATTYCNFKDFCNVKIDALVWIVVERDWWSMTKSVPIQKGTDGMYYLCLMSLACDAHGVCTVIVFLFCLNNV